LPHHFTASGGCSVFMQQDLPFPQTITRESCRIFFSSLAAGDYTTAKKYGTEHTVKVIGFVENLSSFAVGGKLILNDDKDSLKYCLIQGKTATCVYSSKKGGDVMVHLLRIRGRWLVDLQKQEP
jgi:hypothetical protein